MSREIELAIREARKKKLASTTPSIPIETIKKVNLLESKVSELENKVPIIPDVKDGYTPIKNIDYFDGEPGKPGKNGKTPKKGEDYFTPEEVKQFKKEVTPKKGKDYDDGKDGSPDTPHEIRDKLSTLKGRERLDAKHIKNIGEYVSLSVTQMGGGQNGGSYTLPKASPTILGGVKVGQRLTIDANGVLSADVQTGATGVESIVAGTDIAVDNTDSANPIVNFNGTIPTQTSQLTNDSGFITKEETIAFAVAL